MDDSDGTNVRTTKTGPAPLEPMDPRSARIIDLAGYRIQPGRNTQPYQDRCKHRKLVYSHDERRVWCEDCDRHIETFDAFLAVIRGLEDMMRAAHMKLDEARAASEAVIIRRAAKNVDRIWGQHMAPCCPHCSRGLLPHDFTCGAASLVSQEFENARRTRARQTREEKPFSR